jgi:hypothetical protein
MQIDVNQIELETILKGLDAVKEAENTNLMMGELFTAMLSDDRSPDAQKKRELERKQRIAEAQEARRDQDERLLLLKAKLIEAKRRAELSAIA